MIHTFESVFQIARQARTDLESGAVSQDLLAELYSDYCSDIDVTLFLEGAAQIFPVGNCGIASVYLRHLLHVGEPIFGSYNEHGHTIWHLGKNMIADITCDQFGGPKVYVGPLVKPWSFDPPEEIDNYISPSSLKFS